MENNIVSAKRLIHLYLLNVEIPERCHRAISSVFEYLDFDDSLDEESCVSKISPMLTTTVKKYDKKGKLVCSYVCTRVNNICKKIVDFRGNDHAFLENVKRLCFYDSKQYVHVPYYEINQFIEPFIICILYRKGIDVDNILL